MLFGEFAPDLSLLGLGAGLVQADNAIPSDRGLVPFKRAVSQSAALDEHCRGALGIEYYDTSTQIFAGDRTKLYKVNETLATDVSKAGGYDLDAGTDPYWDMVAYGETVLAVNLSELVQQFDKNDALFSDLTDAPRARHVSTLGLQDAFVVLGDLIEEGSSFPNKIAWNEPGNLDSWTPGVGFAGEQVLEGDGGRIINLVSGEFGAVFQERAIWSFEFVGPPVVFLFRQIMTDHGAVGVRASVVHNNNIYYLNRTGFYVIDRGQGSQPRPIGAGRVDKTFWDRVDIARLDDVVATADSENDVIYWSYPTQNSAVNISTEALVYSPIADKWGFIREETNLIGVEFQFTGFSTTQTLDDIDGLIDAEPLASVSVDDASFAGTRRFLMGFDQNHTLAYFTGEPRVATFLTGLMALNPDGYALVNKMRPLAEQPGVTRATLVVRDNPADPGKQLPIRDLSSHGYFEFRTARPRPRARYFQVGLEISGGWFVVNGVNAQGHHVHAVGER